VNFNSVALTDSAILKNPATLDLNLQAVSGTGGFTKTGLGTLYLSDQPNQAAAFAVLKGTVVPTTVESINVEYVGNGYSVAPEVTLVGGGATTQATATATIDNKGRVISIAVTSAGSGYTSLPRVQIAAPPTVATANSYTGATTVEQGKLNLSGSYASSLTVKSGAALQLDWLAAAEARCSIDQISSGTGYSANAATAYVKDIYLTKSVGGYTPGATLNLTIDAPRKTDGTTLVPGGVAATATATVNSEGVISALSIVTGGSSYAIPPKVTIPAPTVPTVVATTTGSITFESGAVLSLNIAPPSSASYTLFTANGGITGTPELETPISGYSLVKEGNSLVLKADGSGSNTAPVITAAQGFSVAENVALATVVGTVVATDADANSTLSEWAIVSGNTGSAFAINAATGQISVAGALNYEGTPSYSLGVTVSDGTATSAVGTVVVTVTNIAEYSDVFGSSSPTADDNVDGISNLMAYSLGATSPSSVVVPPALNTADPTKLTMTALIRINDSKVSVVGEYGLTLGTWVTGSPIAGVPSSSQTGAVAGVTQRQDFSVSRGTDLKKFMRLKATQAP
jgi:hypothetical protein